MAGRAEDPRTNSRATRAPGRHARERDVLPHHRPARQRTPVFPAAPPGIPGGRHTDMHARLRSRRQAGTRPHRGPSAPVRAKPAVT